MWVEFKTYARDSLVMLNTDNIAAIMENFERPETTFIYTVETEQGLLVNANYNEVKKKVLREE